MSRRPPAKRDQDESPFSGVLLQLCAATGAHGAALVDAEGETVDYAGQLSPYEIRVAAAEWQIVIALIHRQSHVVGDKLRDVVIRARTGSAAAYPLSEGYVLVVLLSAGAFGISHRALCVAARALCEEAGLALPEGLGEDSWEPVSVREDSGGRHRPSSVEYSGHWCEAEVLGQYQGPELGPRELSFRIRLENGLEATVVRERLGRWYTEQGNNDAS